ncbi:DUF1015 domain-containing protein [Clostridia bacterium]|nr:DUF1015 domain-containing protein [Clostridia bacterium]
MSLVKPFMAVRPKEGKESAVASLPYDVMNRKEAKEMAGDNKDSFLHIVRAEIDVDDSVSQYDDSVYAKGKENLDKMISEGILVQDEKPCFYVYQQVMDGRTQTGLVACCSIDEYLSNSIKKHEFTREAKEIDRIKHFDACDANTAPIFLTYRNNEKINAIIAAWVKKDAMYDFVSEDGIGHKVWKIDDADVIAELDQLFAGVDNLYIADGHHRSASAAKVGLKRREANPNYTGDEEFNRFLAVIFPDNDLYVMDYNRVVKDLNGNSKDEFMSLVKEKFNVAVSDQEGPYKPDAKHKYGMYLDGKWYVLEAKEGSFDAQHPVKSLDSAILQDNLLNPILGIGDPRTDERIDFIGGIRGLEELERRVSEDMEVAFSMFPTSIKDLMKVADAGEVMPPKSTWFEPKLRSGLFVHKLS